MNAQALTLVGRHIRLELLSQDHVDGLVAAAAADPSLYQWSPVPQGKQAVSEYIANALESRDAVPFATIRISDGQVIGSTRFFNLERWPWPRGHRFFGRTEPDACEIGYTWLTRAAIRTAANTEAKFLMLKHAFEQWRVLRVCFHTDVRNQRSQAAIERIGGKREGILRAHRIAAVYKTRDSVRYSIIASEWPGVQKRLRELLAQT